MILKIAFIASIVFLSILALSVLFLMPRFIYAILGFGKRIKFNPKTDKKTKFAVLIPARNESNVIADTLKALTLQDYPKELYDIFVIVKEKNDKTISISKMYDAKALVAENQKCKGDALDYAIKHIYENELKYDAFLIFDADNILAPNFLSEMSVAVESGYDMGGGYLNSKNWNDGFVASSSALTFRLLGTLTNKGRAKLGVNCIFSGTGFFIAEHVIAEHKCWPFKTLTEDYELSLYATQHNLKTTYVETAEFLDEQPTKMKTSIKQRVRWVKGFLQVRKKYSKSLLKSFFKDKENKWSKLEQTFGLMPVATIITSLIVYIFLQFGLLIAALATGISAMPYLLTIFRTVGITYCLLIIFTAVQFVGDIKRINITSKNLIKTLILNPIFMALYIPIAIKAMFTKEIKWDKIEHGKAVKMIEYENKTEEEIEPLIETK